MRWTAHLHGGPQRVNHAAVAVGQYIYSFGGYSTDDQRDGDKDSMDINVFDTMSLSWSCMDQVQFGEDVPPNLYGHTVVSDGKKIWLYGGRDSLMASCALYCYNTVTELWSLIHTSGKKPEALDGHTACLHEQYMYVFGGFGDLSEFLSNSVHRLNLNTYEWEMVCCSGRPPSKRDFHSASVIGDRMFVFGGRSFIDDSNYDKVYYGTEMKYLDLKSHRWETPSCIGDPPDPRRSHTATVYKDEIYFIGGYNSNTKKHFNDIHKFNPATNEWFKVKANGRAMSPRRRHIACAIADHLYVFGGSSPDDESSETNLKDHSDMYIIDFFPTLKRLCIFEVLEQDINYYCLPECLQREMRILENAMPYHDKIDNWILRWMDQLSV